MLLLLLLWVLLIKQIENRKKIDNQKTTGWFTLLGHYRQWQTVSSSSGDGGGVANSRVNTAPKYRVRRKREQNRTEKQQ